MTDYGTDVRFLFGAGGTIDLDPYFQPIEGVTAVAHAVARRLVTPAGSLSWDSDVGLDLRQYVNEGLVPAQLPAIASLVRIEAEKDERVESAKADAKLDRLTGVLSISITCTTAAGPFTLVLSVTSLTVELLSTR